jgi:hypothetical protein
MKLARIEHIRCDESTAFTILLVPDVTTEDDLDRAVQAARKARDVDTNAFLAHEPKPEYPYPNLQLNGNNLPDTTTYAEIKAAYEKKKLAYDEWQKRRDAATRSFASYIKEFLPGASDLYDAEALETSVNWGHRHGEKIDYGEHKDTDLKGEAVRLRRSDVV